MRFTGLHKRLRGELKVKGDSKKAETSSERDETAPSLQALCWLRLATSTNKPPRADQELIPPLRRDAVMIVVCRFASRKKTRVVRWLADVTAERDVRR